MADLSRVREPLEIAAASSDARVRGMALRRKELEAEIRKVDDFFEFYMSQSPANGNTTPDPEHLQEKARKPRTAAATASGKAASAQGAKRGRHGAFLENIKKALLKYGPLDKESLFAKYREFAPEDATRTVESMRVSLIRYPETVTRVSPKDKRYWLAGEALPDHALAEAA